MSGHHSWDMLETVKREDGSLAPIKWRCRNCDTIKALGWRNRAEYEFPEGHEKHFVEGLPAKDKAGHCPYGARRTKQAEWGEP